MEKNNLIKQHYTFTICTPIYNGASTIHRVFESLLNQTLQDFEWIVINDGSTDNSLEIMKSFIKTTPFPIRLFSQSNQGKGSAVNSAVEKALGDFFIIADADDSFAPISLEFFLKIWKNHGNDSLCGIASLCQNQFEKIVGSPYPENIYRYNYLKNNYSKNKIGGEKWLMIRTTLMKRYPFKISKSYIPESHVWNAIGYDYDIIGINTVLRTYYINESEHSITQQNKKIPPYFGRSIVYSDILNYYLDKFSYYQTYKFFKSYLENAVHADISITTIFKNIFSFKSKLVILVLLPKICLSSYIKKNLHWKKERC